MPAIVAPAPGCVGENAPGMRTKTLATPGDLSVPGPRRALFVSLAGCALFASVLAFSGLGQRPLISPAEARYALVAREMLESGDWIQPRFNHARFDEKPPLTFWCVAASYRLFGFTEFASRLPSALAYVGTVLLTFLLAFELVGRGTAPLAALIYATSLGPFLFGRFLFTDTLLVFWLTLSLLGLAKIVRRPAQRAGPLIFYAGAAFAGLTKGLIGLLFPFAAAAAYALLAGGGRTFLRRLRPVLGAAIVAVIFLPWHVLMAWRDPEFLRFYFVGEHFTRFLTRREPVNYTPLSVPAFWISTLLWLFPWFLFLPGALPRRRGHWSRRLSLVWIWSVGILLFFTLTGSRMEYYGLPALPGLAVIVGASWRRFMTGGRRAAAIRVPSLLVAGIGLAALPLVFLPAKSGLAALTGLVSSLDGYYREYFAAHPGASMIFGAELLRKARPFPIVLLLLGASTLVALRLSRRRPAFALWVAGVVPILGLAAGGMRLMAQDRSQRSAAEIVGRNWTRDARLVVAGDYEEACGITFYTGRATQVLGGPGADLLFGFRRGDAPDVFLSPAAFLGAWESPHRVFVLGGRDLSLPGAVVLLEGPRSRLLMRDPCAAEPAAAPVPLADRSGDPYRPLAHDHPIAGP
jgi:4-amino-4-deoxy-L-arabinose transferase-like glycosyltransferase